MKPVNYFFLILCFLSGARAAAQLPVKAANTEDFLNSIGVNSSVSKRGENLEKTIELCKYLGIRWIRSGYEGDIPVNDMIELHRRAGVKFSYGLLSGGADLDRLMRGAKELARHEALLAIEGLNEPNNWGITYKGTKGGRDQSWLPVAQLQRDLYETVKNDPALKSFPVWALSENGAQTENTGLQFLKIPDNAGTVLPSGTVYADYANCHNYFIHPSHPYLYDNQTWNAADPGPLCKVDGLYGNYGLTWKNRFAGYAAAELEHLPRVTTETGAALGNGLTEEKQARLFLNLYLAQFARGWRFTALYLLRDRSDESGNQSFGFYKPDYAPRKSALYLHHLTRILGDQPETGQRGGELAYALPALPVTSHHLLLQKKNGKFMLVLWAERVNGNDTVKLVLAKPAAVRVFDPTQGTMPVQQLKRAKEHTFILSDHPLILEI